MKPITRYSLLAIFAFLLSFAAAPALAQTGILWNAQFFNNPYLGAPAALSRQDTAIYFNWGSGAPVDGVNADNFSARWSTITNFAAGTYRFYILADDGVHLYIDNTNLVIDTYDSPRAGQLLTADVTLTAGFHNLQVDYRENGGDAYIYVTWADLATNPTGPNFPIPGSVTPGGIWTAEYYSSSNLSGSPTAIISETSPQHNWGSAAPLTVVPADNFSVRWTSRQFLNAGQYQFSVKADDGVRLSINGVRHIDEWHGATGQVYGASIFLPTGEHTIVVEYYEAGGLASLEYDQRLAGQSTNAPVSPTSAAASVTAFRLNVRNEPNPFTGLVVTKISRGEVYNVLGRNTDSSWYQLQVGGLSGWVNARYISVTNAQIVPITSNTTKPTTPPPAVTSFVLRAKENLNIRSGAGTNFTVLGRLPGGTSASIIARKADLSWWYITYSGITGWVSGAFVDFPSGVDFNAVPLR